MPVSDQLLVLALALASPSDPKLPLSLNAESVGQPSGGAHARAIDSYVKTQSQIKTTAPIKSEASMKCASGEHAIKYWRSEARGKVQAQKCAPIKYEPQIQKTTSEHFPK